MSSKTSNTLKTGFTCNYCNRFIDYDDVKTHNEKEHLNCKWCEIPFKNVEEWNKHNIENHKKIFCDICGLKCEGTIKLNEHKIICEKEEEEFYKKNEEIIEATKEDEEKEKQQPKIDIKKVFDEQKEKLNKELEEKQFNLLFNGEKGLSDIFIDYQKDDIKLIDTKTCKGYHYSQFTNLWEEKEKAYFVSFAMNFLEKYVADELKKYIDNPNRVHKKVEELTKILNKCRTKSFITNIFELASPYLVDNDFCDNINTKEETKYLLSFKNGVYDIEKGKLRNRTRADCMSECLPFDYNEDNDLIIKKKDEIKKIIFTISNENEQDYDFNLRWFGYNITGDIKEQKFLIGLGERASNGKTTLFEIFEQCLPIYTLKMKNNTFNKNNKTSHKQFAMLLRKPIRLSYIEEMDESMQDMALIKDFTGGKRLTNEVMFGTMVKGGIKLTSKLTLIGNKNVIFSPDNGALRRGLLEEFKTIFMEEKDYKKLPIERRKGKAIKNKNISNLFNQYEYKMAFISLLIEYAKKYIKEGLIIPDHIEDNFKSLFKENDTIENFINEFYDITEDNKDRVHKDDFCNLYNLRFKTKTKWAVLLSDIKRHLNYDAKAKESKKPYRQGCILGIKPKKQEEDEINERFDIL